jgi:protein subunit release factor B
MPKRLLFSVSIKDCRVETFRAGGPGGQNQNKRDSAARVHHDPSGAVGESRQYRTQLENKRAAFARMAAHAKFKFWVANKTQELAQSERTRQWVRETMSPENIRVEVMTNGEWEKVTA